MVATNLLEACDNNLEMAVNMQMEGLSPDVLPTTSGSMASSQVNVSYICKNLLLSFSVTDSSTLSNPADAQNVSCLGLCGRDICPKSSA